MKIAWAMVLVLVATAAEARSRPIRPRGDVDVLIVAGGRILPFEGRGADPRLVHGDEGDPYIIRVINNTDRWVEIVAAVDGLDVIDGDRADYCHKRGYVLSPGSSYDIEGWRTSLSSVDRFRFVHPAASEAARKGTAWSHLGWIQVAFFFGRLSPSPPLLPPPSGAGVFRGEDVEAPAPAEAADLDGRGAHDEARPPAAKSGAWRERSWDPLGTGRGESAWAPAEETSFWRDHETRPDRMINIRYVR